MAELRAIAAPRRILRDDAAEAVQGIAIVALAYFVMTVGDVAGKWALPAAGVAGVMFWRGIIGGGAVAALAVAEGGIARLRPVRWRMVALRSGLNAAVSVTWYWAWLTIPLADSYAIGFIAPLLMTVLAIPMLGERIRWRRALSTAVGFLGVLIMLRPGGGLWQPSVTVLLLGIVGMAVSRNMTRMLATTETPECLAFWMLVSLIPVGVGLIPFFPGAGGMGWDTVVALLVLGLTNAGAHCLHARAYGLAPVSALAPYEYTMLIWGAVLGFLVFHEVPSASGLLGAAVVAAAGIYNLHRERLRRAAEARAAARRPEFALPDRS